MCECWQSLEEPAGTISIHFGPIAPQKKREGARKNGMRHEEKESEERKKSDRNNKVRRRRENGGGEKIVSQRFKRQSTGPEAW